MKEKDMSYADARKELEESAKKHKCLIESLKMFVSSMEADLKNSGVVNFEKRIGNGYLVSWNADGEGYGLSLFKESSCENCDMESIETINVIKDHSVYILSYAKELIDKEIDRLKFKI